MNPGPSFPMADVVWGQTERDRVCASCYFNSLLSFCLRIKEDGKQDQAQLRASSTGKADLSGA